MEYCTTIEVEGLFDGYDNVMVNGEYSLSKIYVSWAQDKPVYEHIDLPFYLYWNDVVDGWTIGPKEGLHNKEIFFYKSKLL